MSVESGEHHYQMVLRVVQSAMQWTHLPTLAMAVLAFAIMFGLRRLNPRLPNVLVAVVVTTLLAALLGFQRDEKVPVEELDTPALGDRIAGFNHVISEQQRLEELRFEARGLVQQPVDYVEKVGADTKRRRVQAVLRVVTVEARPLGSARDGAHVGELAHRRAVGDGERALAILGLGDGVGGAGQRDRAGLLGRHGDRSRGEQQDREHARQSTRHHR